MWISGLEVYNMFRGCRTILSYLTGTATHYGSGLHQHAYMQLMTPINVLVFWEFQIPSSLSITYSSLRRQAAVYTLKLILSKSYFQDATSKILDITP